MVMAPRSTRKKSNRTARLPDETWQSLDAYADSLRWSGNLAIELILDEFLKAKGFMDEAGNAIEQGEAK